MTSEQFLSQFEKFLYVAEPKRSELIREIQAHLEELQSNDRPEIILGSPRALAERLNRTHIGWWGTTLGFYLIPVGMMAMYLAARYLLRLLPDPNAIPWLTPILYMMRFVPPLIGAMMFGQALGRSHRIFPRAPLAILIAGCAIWVIGNTGYQPEIGDTEDAVPLLNLFSLLIQMSILLIVGSFSYLMERPRKQPKQQ